MAVHLPSCGAVPARRSRAVGVTGTILRGISHLPEPVLHLENLLIRKENYPECLILVLCLLSFVAFVMERTVNAARATTTVINSFDARKLPHLGPEADMFGNSDMSIRNSEK